MSEVLGREDSGHEADRGVLVGTTIMAVTGTAVVPEYWWPPVAGSWAMTGAGALTHFWKSIAPRKSENSS